MDLLPVELKLAILSFLRDLKTLLVVRSCCSEWKVLAQMRLKNLRTERTQKLARIQLDINCRRIIRSGKTVTIFIEIPDRQQHIKHINLRSVDTFPPRFRPKVDTHLLMKCCNIHVNTEGHLNLCVLEPYGKPYDMVIQYQIDDKCTIEYYETSSLVLQMKPVAETPKAYEM